MLFDCSFDLVKRMNWNGFDGGSFFSLSALVSCVSLGTKKKNIGVLLFFGVDKRYKTVILSVSRRVMKFDLSLGVGLECGNVRRRTTSLKGQLCIGGRACGALGRILHINARARLFHFN